MKNPISKIVLTGAVLAATLSAALAAPRHQPTRDTAGYMYDMGSSPNSVYNNHMDNEQSRRDFGGQGG